VSFVELRFVLFFAAVFGVHWVVRSSRWRKVVLLGASYVFYGAWDVRFLSLIVVSTLVDYLVCLGLRGREEPRARRRLLGVSLIVNLGLLGTFKYFDFFSASAARLLVWLGLPVSAVTLDLVLPVGISFYTFQTLSYTIDVYRRNLEPTRDLLDFSLFVAFFPQLVAGPIVRARDFLPQLAVPRRLAEVAFRPALTLFLLGFVKKACVADNVASAVDPLFADPSAFAPGMLWLGGVLYSIQIYCDFSGYSDMAIATAALLGYRLPLNFDFPLFSRSVTEFWRRWHISLSTWFRDYLYIPLGGNRGSRLASFRNLWLVFLLCALWHGAAWTFVAWGTIHGLALVLERAFSVPGRLDRTPLSLVRTFAIVTCAWVFFRAATLEDGARYLLGMFGGGPGASVLAGWGEWLAVALAFLAVHAANRVYRVDRLLERAPEPVFGVIFGTAAALALPFVAAHYQPFIYFQF